MIKSKLMKQKWWPRPHTMRHSWLHGLETGVVNEYTFYPLAMYDEGLGSPSSYTANPENASFAESSGPNCFVESKVNSIDCFLNFQLTKVALETDLLHAVNVCFMPVYMSFLENYTAISEYNSIEVQDVFELQTESTDRQGYPVYNGVKLVEKFTNSALLATTVPGLTTTQVIEGIPFSPNQYYDAVQHYTISGKVKSSSGGLKWHTLTRSKPNTSFKLHIRPKSKRMNPYTFFGVIIGVPKAGSHEQIPMAGDTTNISHVSVDVTTRFLEWNQDFNFKKV